MYERWYFARRLTEVTTVVDISTTLAVKVEAALAHATMMRHYAHQLCLQARTGGHALPLAEAAAAARVSVAPHSPVSIDLFRSLRRIRRCKGQQIGPHDLVVLAAAIGDKSSKASMLSSSERSPMAAARSRLARASE